MYLRASSQRIDKKFDERGGTYVRNVMQVYPYGFGRNDGSRLSDNAYSIRIIAHRRISGETEELTVI
jgi:hypothetical protein